MGSHRLIAQNIKKIRLLRGLSQEKLALEAEVDRGYVSKIEREKGNPTVEVLDKLATALSVKTVELFAEISSKAKLKPLPRGRRTERATRTK